MVILGLLPGWVPLSEIGCERRFLEICRILPPAGQTRTKKRRPPSGESSLIFQTASWRATPSIATTGSSRSKILLTTSFQKARLLPYLRYILLWWHRFQQRISISGIGHIEIKDIRTQHIYAPLLLGIISSTLSNKCTKNMLLKSETYTRPVLIELKIKY